MAQYRKKYMKHHSVVLDDNTDVHHIDWNRKNNDIDNLIAIPKWLHKRIHSDVGYMTRLEIEISMDKGRICLIDQDKAQKIKSDVCI